MLTCWHTDIGLGTCWREGISYRHVYRFYKWIILKSSHPISILTSVLGRLHVGNHVGPTSASDVGPTSSCSSDRRRADVYVGLTSGRRRPNVHCQHSANVMPALNLMHMLANVEPMSGQCQANVRPTFLIDVLCHFCTTALFPVLNFPLMNNLKKR